MPLAEETEHETNTILGAGGNFADSARRLLNHGAGVFCGINRQNFRDRGKNSSKQFPTMQNNMAI
jgi:hypothetical protein